MPDSGCKSTTAIGHRQIPEKACSVAKRFSGSRPVLRGSTGHLLGDRRDTGCGEGSKASGLSSDPRLVIFKRASRGLTVDLALPSSKLTWRAAWRRQLYSRPAAVTGRRGFLLNLTCLGPSQKKRRGQLK